MNGMGDGYDIIVTKGTIFLLKSNQRCESCLYWGVVYCLESRKEQVQSIVELSRELKGLLDAIPTLKWGHDKSTLSRLFNHCEKCDARFFDPFLFHPGEAFTPIRKIHCEKMLIIELPIKKPQEIVGLRAAHSNNVHLDYARRISWKKFTDTQTHKKETTP